MTVGTMPSYNLTLHTILEKHPKSVRASLGRKIQKISQSLKLFPFTAENI